MDGGMPLTVVLGQFQKKKLLCWALVHIQLKKRKKIIFASLNYVLNLRLLPRLENQKCSTPDTWQATSGRPF